MSLVKLFKSLDYQHFTVTAEMLGYRDRDFQSACAEVCKAGLAGARVDTNQGKLILYSGLQGSYYPGMGRQLAARMGHNWHKVTECNATREGGLEVQLGLGSQRVCFYARPNGLIIMPSQSFHAAAKNAELVSLTILNVLQTLYNWQPSIQSAHNGY